MFFVVLISVNLLFVKKVIIHLLQSWCVVFTIKGLLTVTEYNNCVSMLFGGQARLMWYKCRGGGIKVIP